MFLEVSDQKLSPAILEEEKKCKMHILGSGSEVFQLRKKSQQQNDEGRRVDLES